MKVIEILKLNRELLKTCHYMGIRPDDVQYIELYNEYNKLHTNGEKSVLYRSNAFPTIWHQ